VSTLSIVLVDDHRVVTASLKAYLESFPDLRVVGVAANGEELLRRFGEWRAEVVLQDLMMPGGIDGIETIRRLRQQWPAVRIVALTASMDEARLMGALKAGAMGYVRKDADPSVLLAAVRAVGRGRTYIDPAVATQLAHAVGAPEELTSRETDVLRHVALGRSNKEIGSALGIGEETVKTHVGHLLAKLQVENRGQAIVQALKRGLVSLEDIE
jgi:NarL family two-component system response regulator LiaR